MKSPAAYTVLPLTARAYTVPFSALAPAPRLAHWPPGAASPPPPGANTGPRLASSRTFQPFKSSEPANCPSSRKVPSGLSSRAGETAWIAAGAASGLAGMARAEAGWGRAALRAGAGDQALTTNAATNSRDAYRIVMNNLGPRAKGLTYPDSICRKYLHQDDIDHLKD